MLNKYLKKTVDCVDSQAVSDSLYLYFTHLWIFHKTHRTDRVPADSAQSIHGVNAYGAQRRRRSRQDPSRRLSLWHASKAVGTHGGGEMVFVITTPAPRCAYVILVSRRGMPSGTQAVCRYKSYSRASSCWRLFPYWRRCCSVAALSNTNISQSLAGAPGDQG